jgi:hypothetical protein
MSWIIFKSVVSALVVIVLVGGVYLVYLKKYDPVIFALRKLEFQWWRLTARARFLIWLTGELEKLLDLAESR